MQTQADVDAYDVMAGWPPVPGLGHEGPLSLDWMRTACCRIHYAATTRTAAIAAIAFRQPKAPADAERSLQTKETKKSREGVRIAGNKIERAMGKLADLKRAEGRGRDSRMFSGVYASVIVSEGGKVTIKPMRYQCRLAGKPANYYQRFPGTYNAR